MLKTDRSKSSGISFNIEDVDFSKIRNILRIYYLYTIRDTKEYKEFTDDDIVKNVERLKELNVDSSEELL